MPRGGEHASERISGLPAVAGPARPHLSLYRPTAPFVAQMLVTAPRPGVLAAADTRAGHAARAYAAGATISVRRIPAGFRRTLLV